VLPQPKLHSSLMGCMDLVAATGQIIQKMKHHPNLL